MGTIKATALSVKIGVNNKVYNLQMKKLLFALAFAILLPSIVQAAISPKELITLANQDRAASHIAPLKENPILTKAAQKRADYLASDFDRFSPVSTI